MEKSEMNGAIIFGIANGRSELWHRGGKDLGRSVQPNLVNLGIWATNFQPYDGQLGAAEVLGREGRKVSCNNNLLWNRAQYHWLCLSSQPGDITTARRDG